MKPTIKDIAKEAGVTHATVSRALNNEAGVSETMRKKILAISERIGYVPNIAAKRLADRDTNCIGLIWPRDESLFYFHLCNQIHLEAMKRGFHTMISLAAPEQAIKLFEEHFIDRILLWATPRWTPPVDFIKSMESFRGSLLIMGGASFAGSHRIAIDRSEGIYRAVAYLAELGHRKITFIGNNQEKLLGFTKAILELHLDYHSDYTIQTDKAGQYESRVTEMLNKDKNDRPTALIVENQQISVDVVKLLRKNKVKVPNDFSLIVYDDIPEMRHMMDIPVTTVGPDRQELASKAIDVLSSAKPSDKHFNEFIVCPELKIRESTAPLTNI